MTRIRIAITVALLLITGLSHLKCQVCGISGSKLTTSCAGAIDLHSLEFEVLYSFEKYTFIWDHDGSRVPFTADSQNAATGSDLFIRATFGVFRNAEIGAAVDKEADEASLGFKWMPVRFAKTSVALSGGIRFGFGENSDQSMTFEESLPKAVSGALLYSYEINPSLSFDLNIGYNILIQGIGPALSGCLDLCGDFGWRLAGGKLQAVMGAGLKSGSVTKDQEKFRLVTLYPGITVTTGSDYEILIALPRDIYGINHPKRNSVICALTITLH